MTALDHRKKSIYLPDELADELEAEARRLDRSESWLIQQAWRFARERIRALPRQELA